MRNKLIGAATVTALSLNLLAVATPAKAEPRYELVQPVAVTTWTEEVPVPVTAERAAPPKQAAAPKQAPDTKDESLSSKVGSFIGMLALVLLFLGWYGWNSVYNPNGRHADMHRQ